MITHVFPTPQAVGTALAATVVDAIVERPSLVLGLPTGRTPLPFYDALRRESVRRAVSWREVRTFNLDEFVGVPPTDAESYRAYMTRELFGPLGLPAAHIGFLDGTAPDLERECERYEEAIRAAGGIDLMILGIGANGHIGFNEPAAGLQARTHRARLEPETRASNAAQFGGDVARVPREALSMGMATICQARAVALMATGAGKAAAVRGMRDGAITAALPASFLQLHPSVTLWLDAAAATS